MTLLLLWLFGKYWFLVSDTDLPNLDTLCDTVSKKSNLSLSPQISSEKSLNIGTLSGSQWQMQIFKNYNFYLKAWILPPPNPPLSCQVLLTNTWQGMEHWLCLSSCPLLVCNSGNWEHGNVFGWYGLCLPCPELSPGGWEPEFYNLQENGCQIQKIK